jgi:ubiquinone/menaquinone biosynthesis C-methylase UbiE
MKYKFTKLSRKYWANRNIDWTQAYFNEHSHRDLLMKVFTKMKFGSIIEVGCASGKNLAMIKELFPNVEVGGVDINADAIETAKKLIPNAAVLEVSDATKLFLSDKSVDIVLTDMCLIYMDSFNIRKAIKEIRRVARKGVVLCELHSESWWTRLFYPYNLHNYRKLLNKYGFWDIELYKLKEKDWEGGEPQKSFGYVVLAKL